MATEQVTVTKTDQIDSFTSTVRNYINGQTVWYSGSYPSPSTGFPTSWMGGGKNPGGPTTGNLSSSAINASILAEALQSWCRQYTRVRKFRFRRTGNLQPYDSTQITHMNNSYLQSNQYADINNTDNQYNILPGQTVDASNFNAYVVRLRDKWIGYKNSTVTYTYNYCHSNCHSSCHSSTRWRR